MDEETKKYVDDKIECILKILKDIKSKSVLTYAQINFILFLFSVGYLWEDRIYMLWQNDSFWETVVGFFTAWFLHPLFVGMKLAGLDISRLDLILLEAIK